jgi:hypothetical protein
MKRITITKHIKLDLTPDDWCLYTRAKNTSNCANFLNLNIATVLNTTEDASEAYDLCFSFMKRMSHVGAIDTEPMQVLSDILCNFYGVEYV